MTDVAGVAGLRVFITQLNSLSAARSGPQLAWLLEMLSITYCFALCLLSLPLVLAALVNVTVDDAGPDPRTGAQFTYLPPDQWNFGPTCLSCINTLDPSRLENRTWHSSTFRGVVEFAMLEFTGMCRPSSPAGCHFETHILSRFRDLYIRSSLEI